MGTVAVDRYRAFCHSCGFDREFMIGAGMGDLHAVAEAQRIHDDADVDHECEDRKHEHLIVEVVSKW